MHDYTHSPPTLLISMLLQCNAFSMHHEAVSCSCPVHALAFNASLNSKNRLKGLKSELLYVKSLYLHLSRAVHQESEMK
jgi:hypothetical protein